MDELIITILEALEKIREDLNDNETSIDATKKELNSFEDEYSKDKKLIDKQLTEIYSQIDRLIKEEVSKFQNPKALEEKINSYINAKDRDVSELRIYLVDYLEKELKQWAITNYPKFKGKDAEPVDYTRVAQLIKSEISKFPKPKDGIDGRDGEKGEQGVGIYNIFEEKGYLIVVTTDEQRFKFKLPKVTINNIGGSPRASSTDKQKLQKVLKYTEDASLTTQSQYSLIDATAGAVTIKLPNPANSYFKDTRESLKIAINKTDETANEVIILPHATELLMGKTQQILTQPHEVLNFITDGVDWYLQN